MSQAEEDHRVREHGRGGHHFNLGTPRGSAAPVSGLRSSFVTVGSSAALLSRGTARGSAWGGFNQAATMGSRVPHLLRVGLRAHYRGAPGTAPPPAPGGPSPVPGLGDEPAAGLHLHVQAPLHAAHLHVFVQVAVHVVLGRGQLQLRGAGRQVSSCPARAPRRPTRHAVKEVKGSDSKLNQLEAKGTRYANVPSMFPGEAHPQKAFAKESGAGSPSSLKRLVARAVRRGQRL